MERSLSSRWITVEPLIFSLVAIQGVLINLRTQYLEYRLAKTYNYTLPNVGSVNSSCWLNSTNTTQDGTQSQIEAETAIWILYLKDTSMFIPIFTATLLAAASDYIGRRPVFIIGSFCHLITSTIFFLVCIFELPLWLLICAQAILGLGGDDVASQYIAYAYLVDVYPEKSRTFRFVILNMITYVSFGVSQLAIGRILQVTQSFQISFLCAVIIGVLNLLYACCPVFIPESNVNSEKIPKGMAKKLFLSYIKLFQRDTNDNKESKKPLILIITLLAYASYHLVHEAIFAVITIYGIAAPFCWTPFETGVYAVMVNMFPALCSVIAVKIMSICLNNFWMLHISILSAVGEQLVVAFAMASVVILYVSPAVGFVRVVAAAIYSAQLSKLVKRDEQGVLFGCTAVVTTIGGLCSGLVLNTSYAAFAKQGEARNTFFLSAGLLGIPMLLNGFLHLESICGKSSNTYVDLEEDYCQEEETADGGISEDPVSSDTSQSQC